MSQAGTPGAPADGDGLRAAGTEAGPPAARVLDIRYSGAVEARPTRQAAIVVLALWSLRRVLGVRRSWTAKIWPLGLLGLAFAPGLAVLAVRALFVSSFGADELPVDLLPYANYLGVINLVVLVFTATVVPGLLCPDRRDRVLSLYRSTALGGLDYLAAKAAAAFVLLLALTALPVLVLFTGNLLFADDLVGMFTDEADLLWRVPLAGAVVALVQGSLGLAISSLTGRRALAVGGYLALVVTTPVLAGVLAASQGSGASSGWRLLNLGELPFLLAQRVFGSAEGPPSWQVGAACAGVVLVCAGVLVHRYGGDDT